MPRQKYRQNQFGGTIGGPVVLPKLYNGQNKTFFFFDYQRTNITQQAPYSAFTVPTNGMRSSNYSNLQDLINGNSDGVASNKGSNTDGLGWIFPHGTVLDPATTRAVAAHAIDPIPRRRESVVVFGQRKKPLGFFQRLACLNADCASMPMPVVTFRKVIGSSPAEDGHGVGYPSVLPRRVVPKMIVRVDGHRRPPQ